MRIWRGGSPGSGPISDGCGQAARWHVRTGLVARRVSTRRRWPPGALQEATQQVVGCGVGGGGMRGCGWRRRARARVTVMDTGSGARH
jgi:hypothetical protein